MPDGRFALIVASSHYSDTTLTQLQAPAHDAASLAAVLGAEAIGGFQVETLADQPARTVMHEIETFFDGRRREDLVLLYFSGHGILDEGARLYFATTDTRVDRPRSTAVPAAFVNDVMSECRSRRQVLMLDCCNSGSFARGSRPAEARRHPRLRAGDPGLLWSLPTPRAAQARAEHERCGRQQLAAALAQPGLRFRVEAGRVAPGRADAERERLPPLLEARMLDADRRARSPRRRCSPAPGRAPRGGPRARRRAATRPRRRGSSSRAASQNDGSAGPGRPRDPRRTPPRHRARASRAPSRAALRRGPP